MAAIEALSAPESEHAVARMVKVFEHRRNLVVDGLNAIPGMRCARPQGSFYVFPNIEGTGFDEHELADRLLAEEGWRCCRGPISGTRGRVSSGSRTRSRRTSSSSAWIGSGIHPRESAMN